MELFIVDDNPDHQFLLYKLVKELDRPYLVKFFENGRSLHKHMRHLSQSGQNAGFPKLLVLDFNMPSMNGIELLRLLRQPPLSGCPQINEIPIVIMSSEISPVQIQQCYQAGTNTVILKPLYLSDLKDIFQAVCKFWIP